MQDGGTINKTIRCMIPGQTGMYGIPALRTENAKGRGSFRIIDNDRVLFLPFFLIKKYLSTKTKSR